MWIEGEEEKKKRRRERRELSSCPAGGQSHTYWLVTTPSVLHRADMGKVQEAADVSSSFPS